MTLGCFFIIIGDNAKIERKAVYLEPDSPQIPITDNELLRVRMGHADKKYVISIFPDYQFYSFKSEIKDKKSMLMVIGGVILGKDDNSASFQDALKLFTDKLMEQRAKSNQEIVAEMGDMHKQFFTKPRMSLDKKDLEKRLSDRIKELSKNGKFDAANLLLEKIKRIPSKLYEIHENAENAIKKKDYEKAEKDFESARKLAEELEEKDLIAFYKDKIALTRKIPTLLKKQEDFVQKAMESMRTDNFAQAQRAFKQAADASEELMDSRHAEEYALKAKALAEYVKVDAKFAK